MSQEGPLHRTNDPLVVLTFLWGSRYTAEDVNALFLAVRSHLDLPHEFICVTNQPNRLNGNIRVVADREDFADVPNPHGKQYVSSYRRLRVFDADAGSVFGPRLWLLDLDVLVTGDLTPLASRPEPFVGWRDPSGKGLCGSTFLLTAGHLPFVWTNFDPVASPLRAIRAGHRGSDQAWLSYCLPDVPVWTPADGVCSYKRDVRGHSLPPQTRLVFFHGEPKASACSEAWIREARVYTTAHADETSPRQRVLDGLRQPPVRAESVGS